MDRRPTTLEMEVAISDYFNPRANMIVPNISWGMYIHECDLLVITRAGMGYEVEIKISKADLKKDALKPHAHKHKKIRYLYFAIPEFLADCHDLIPERAGILHVCNNVSRYGSGFCGFRVECVRPPKDEGRSYKFTNEEKMDLGRLATMRIWTLKRNNLDLWNRNSELYEEKKEWQKQQDLKSS